MLLKKPRPLLSQTGLIPKIKATQGRFIETRNRTEFLQGTRNKEIQEILSRSHCLTKLTNKVKSLTKASFMFFINIDLTFLFFFPQIAAKGLLPHEGFHVCQECPTHSGC